MRDKIQKIKNEKYQELIDSLLQIDYKKRLDIEQIIDNFIVEKITNYSKGKSIFNYVVQKEKKISKNNKDELFLKKIKNLL